MMIDLIQVGDHVINLAWMQDAWKTIDGEKTEVLMRGGKWTHNVVLNIAWDDFCKLVMERDGDT